MTGGRPRPLPALDHRTAFEPAPAGLVLSRQRRLVDCNRELLAMFSAGRAQRVGRSFEVLHPSAEELQRTGERIVASLDEHGRHAGAFQQAAAWMNTRTRLHAARLCPGSLKAFTLPHSEEVWAWTISH